MKASAKTIARARELIAGGMAKDVAIRKAVAEQVERAKSAARRPGYREAIEWLVLNDDCEWATHDEDESLGSIAVAAAMVRDIFGVDGEKVRKDVRAGLAARGETK